MERETVTKFDLEAAFKALDEIALPDVSGKGRFTPNRINLKERLQAKHAHEVLVEDYFDVSMEEDLNDAQDQREAEVAKAKLARIEKIVDLDAESEDDILPSYVGKVIMQCPQCMTLFYKNEEDIEKSEETPDVVNINEICQHCGNSSGYTLVGKVGEVEEAEVSNFEGGDETETEDELNLDFPEEGTEEVDAEGTGEAGAAMEDEELDLDLDLEAESAEEEEPEEANESLHNSELLDKIEDKNDLKTDIESDHLTLNEELEDLEEPIEEDIADWYRKKFDKPASAKTQQSWEDELNGEMGEISDERRKHLEKKFAQQRDWEARHGVEAEAETTTTPIEEPVMAESMHNSELLDKIEAKNDLKTDIESEHLTLNEETDIEECDKNATEEPLVEAADVRIFVDQSGSLVGRKDEIMARVAADYPGSENQIEFFDDAECAGPRASAEAGQNVVIYTNGDCETNCPDLCKIATIKNIDAAEAPVEESLEAETDELLDELWDGPQPTEAEVEADLEMLAQEAEDAEVFEEFDDSFDTQVNEYLQEVYSNVDKYESTECLASGKNLIVEGIITFKSGKTKATKFVFENSRHIDNKLFYTGLNEGLSNAKKAFRLTCRAEGTKLISESFRYSYKIAESLVKGSIRQ